MPNIASAKKRVRQTQRRTRRNNAIKFQIRYNVKQFNEAVSTKDIGSAKTLLNNAVRVIDKAVSKGIIHKNTAARKKSQLYRKLANADKLIS